MRTALTLVATVGLGLLGCGQAPSFTEEGSKSRSSGDAEKGALGDGETGAGDTAGDEGGADAAGEADAADGGDTDADTGADGDAVDPDDVEIPDAEDKDMEAIKRCLRKWKDNPFGASVTNYKKISAAITVGGFGNAINDTERTSEPWLILVDAGVNVLGAPTYKLLNPNGWYCMKVNVNVMTALTVDLHCNARLVDSRVNVNVGSTQSGGTSAVGVHVLSSVTVNDVRPSGDACIR
jgi:hypothetical protein